MGILESICVSGALIRWRGCGAGSLSERTQPSIEFIDTCSMGIFSIERPPKRFGGYVVPNAFERSLITDDVFVVLALPDPLTRG